MSNLIDTFAEARFGKKAAVPEQEAAAPSTFQRLSSYFTMPQLTPGARKIRDLLEQSVSEEKRLKRRAGKATEYARYRLEKAPEAGGLGWLADIMRASVPGLSISAAESEGIEKEGADPDESLLLTARLAWPAQVLVVWLVLGCLVAYPAQPDFRSS